MSWNKICETWMDSQSIQKVIFIGNRVEECFIDAKAVQKVISCQILVTDSYHFDNKLITQFMIQTFSWFLEAQGSCFKFLLLKVFFFLQKMPKQNA